MFVKFYDSSLWFYNLLVTLGILLELFFKFFKIGIVGFGGGWAILPIIEREVVQNSHWLSPLEFNDLVAIAGSTPGPVAVNAATYIGFKMAGLPGAIFATLGVITPPFVIILLISLFLRAYIKAKIVRYLLLGLKGAVLGLLILAFYSVFKGAMMNLTALAPKLVLGSITLFVIFSVFFLKWHPMLSLIVSGIIGIAAGFIGLLG